MNNEEESPLKQIRTFQGDVAQALNKGEESLVSIQRKEAQRKESSPQAQRGSSTMGKKFAMVLGTIIFLALGSIGGWLGYQKYVEITAPPEPVVSASRLIPVSITTKVEEEAIATKGLIEAMADASATNVPSGEVNHILIEEEAGEVLRPLSTQGLFAALEDSAPLSLIRAFDEIFMYGVLGGSSPSKFLIIRLDSFENTFAGMLAWEESLPQDIAPLMSTEATLRGIADRRPFEDVIDFNKDMRVLKATVTIGEATSTEVVLVYSFYDNATLLISDKISTIRTLIERLNMQKLSR